MYYRRRCRATERNPPHARQQQRKYRNEGHHHDAVVDGIQCRRRTSANGQRGYTEQDAPEGEGVGRCGNRPRPIPTGEDRKGRDR